MFGCKSKDLVYIYKTSNVSNSTIGSILSLKKEKNYLYLSARDRIDTLVPVKSFDGELFVPNKFISAHLKEKSVFIIKNIDTNVLLKKINFTKYTFIKRLNRYESVYCISDHHLSYNSDTMIYKKAISIILNTNYNNSEYCFQNGNAITSKRYGTLYMYETRHPHGFFLTKKEYPKYIKYKYLFNKKVNDYLKSINHFPLMQIEINKRIKKKKVDTTFNPLDEKYIIYQ